MYVPAAFRADDPALSRALVARWPFATLVSVADGAPTASHLPLSWDGEVLIGHLARANPHAEALRAAPTALAIFHGPHAYVSPAGYTSSPNVPTWNYGVVHVTGAVEVIDDRDTLARFVAALTARFEAERDPPWRLEGGPYVERLLGAIVGVRLTPARIETKLKLGQNKSRADREGVIAALSATGRAEDAACAALMAELGLDHAAR